MLPFRSGAISTNQPASKGIVIDQLKFILARGLLQLCAWLPLSMVQAIAGLLGTAMYLIPTRARETTRQNLRLCFPELAEQELDRLTIQSLKETARTALEMGKCWLLPIERVLATIRAVEGKEILEEAVDQGHGVVLLAPHLGNWEVFGYYFTEQFPTTFMYQPPKNRYFDSMIKAARSRGKARLAPTNRQGVAILLKTLKQGNMVGLLPDQEPGEDGGEFADFFGTPALTMTLVSRLVERTGARVICGYARRLPHGRGFNLVFKAADPMIYDADLAKSVVGLNRTVEACVKEAVSQYQWEYKRFKRRPDGSRFYQ
ncbi:MAG: lysophospholipid acyltransferase family protein [Gammaproteobacteria bacterium]|nr:lysophospholipid acyltransferase family protein [Gammaproteobacteria bacterium]